MPLAARDRDEIVAYQPESGVRLELSQTDRQQGPWNRKEQRRYQLCGKEPCVGQ